MTTTRPEVMIMTDIGDRTVTLSATARHWIVQVTAQTDGVSRSKGRATFTSLEAAEAHYVAILDSIQSRMYRAGWARARTGWRP